MTRTQSQRTILTKLNRVADLSTRRPKLCLTSISHFIDVDFLEEAYRRCKNSRSSGIDNETKKSYGVNLKANLESLLDRFKSGSYRAPAVRRVYLDKGDGSKRPIGIPTFEDKILQRAVTMLVSEIYERDFHSFSYGFRPKKSAHDALRRLRENMMHLGDCFVLELDIKSYFDSIPHSKLRNILDKRIRDGVIRKAIDKWLKAGVMEDGLVHRSEKGSPQGGVISPLLANIYLHEVLDEWFVRDVQPRMHGRSSIIRYADDAVLAFERKEDALRVLDALKKRFDKYGLTLHPSKTRLMDFKMPKDKSKKNDDDEGAPGEPRSFDFLGFTHYWGASRRGRMTLKRQTAKDRLRKANVRANQWCRANRHRPVKYQYQILCKKLQGHYAYYGITGNSRSLAKVYRGVIKVWRKWLIRRSRATWIPWRVFLTEFLTRFPLPRGRIVHTDV